MLRKLLSVGGFTLLSRITGFARDALLAWTLGAGVLSDAFWPVLWPHPSADDEEDEANE